MGLILCVPCALGLGGPLLSQGRMGHFQVLLGPLGPLAQGPGAHWMVGGRSLPAGGGKDNIVLSSQEAEDSQANSASDGDTGSLFAAGKEKSIEEESQENPTENLPIHLPFPVPFLPPVP